MKVIFTIICRALAGGALLVACSSADPAPVAPVTPTTPEPSTVVDAGAEAAARGDCTSARAQLVGAIDTVATGNVKVLDQQPSMTTIYVDATAGGPPNSNKNPWTFVSLATGAKVAVTDVSSQSSVAWDLAFKRPVIYTNDGDGGPGKGGAVLIAKDFDAVTAADAAGVTFGTESFLDAECNANTDPTGAVLTTFSTWYDYDESTHILTPADGTWLVHGASGALYKVRLKTYYAAADGGTVDGASGAYVLDVGAL